MSARITHRESLDAALGELLALDLSLPAPAEPLPLRLRPANFQGLAEIIVAQLISRAAAQAILARLKEAVQPFTASQWLASDVSAAGLSQAKLRSLNAVALAVEDGLDLTALADLPADEAMTHLIALPGIGPWTAQVFCLFCAGHRDIFPAGDVALRVALADILSLPERPSVKEAAELAMRWQPLRGAAARLLYAHYATLRGGGAAPL
jgi:DNA-3-methyladenine glycosylase II